ncbi:MAG: hypothetical protein LBS01_02705 [Prevotellaceae bacterium]|jgi:predicted HTH transcriptional regulator|nr:hypothetical protein [Prevotellaceae bacterium]
MFLLGCGVPVSRIPVSEVMEGGVSDPRNATIFKMFALLDIGERSGSGVYNLLSLWEKIGWEQPYVTEKLEPDRTVINIPIEMEDGEAGDELPNELPNELTNELPNELPNNIGETTKRF